MKLRAAILGSGGMGKRHTRALRALDVEIVAVCDSNDASITSYFETFPDLLGVVERYRDFDEMLVHTDADILMITLPPFAHTNQFIRAAQAGKHIFIEKPIALHVSKGIEMVTAAEEAQIITSVGFHMRQGAVVKKLESLIASGEAGKPVLFNARYGCNSLHTPWWRQKDKSGGQIFEQVIHLYDLGRHLFGEPQTVHCLMANVCHSDIPDYSVEDISSAISITDAGAISSISATNCAVPGKWSESFTAVFEQVTVECSGVNHAEFTYTRRDPIETEVIDTEEDNHFKGVQEFITCVQEKRQTSCPISEGLKSLQYVAAAVASAEQDGAGVSLSTIQKNEKGEYNGQ
ncbi:MAG: Gfo/Idh/MocA family oxidoreductase [Sphaerochaetaceae bacterium]|nr:Gfo/Idh/MocA family oxidoreductase [Sphaerochaetaceae bacterium]